MDDESTSPKKNKKVVQRDLLGRAITKKKEEKHKEKAKTAATTMRKRVTRSRISTTTST